MEGEAGRLAAIKTCGATLGLSIREQILSKDSKKYKSNMPGATRSVIVSTHKALFIIYYLLLLYSLLLFLLFLLLLLYFYYYSHYYYYYYYYYHYYYYYSYYYDNIITTKLTRLEQLAL